MAVYQMYLYNLSSLGSYSGGTVRDLFDDGSTGESTGAIGQSITFASNGGQKLFVSDSDGDFDESDFNQDTFGSHVLEGWSMSSGTSIGTYSVPSGSSIDIEYGYQITPAGGGSPIWIYAVSTDYPSTQDTNGFTATSAIDPGETYTITAYDTSPDPAYSTMIVCFTKGTMIETEEGQKAVEAICVGDRVATLDEGYQPVFWVGCREMDPEILKALPHLVPVRIAAGALGEGMPQVDLVVSPQHRLLARTTLAQKMFGAQEVLLPAKDLTCLPGVSFDSPDRRFSYFHFMCGAHQVVNANGAWAESMYAGPMALRALDKAMRREVLDLFPQLAQGAPTPARPLVRGPKAGRFIAEINKQGTVLVQSA